MSKAELYLIHWNEAEAVQHAESLSANGWHVHIEFEDGARASKWAKDNQPDAIVIFHTRLPSHTRVTDDYLARTKATRHIPLFIVGGEGEALQKTKANLPVAIYTTEQDLISALSTVLET